MTGLSAAVGFVLDYFFGDPISIPHPIVFMGRTISFLEKFLRGILPKTKKGELFGGGILVCLMLLFTALFFGGASFLLYKINPLLAFLADSFWCGQALAMKGLKDESTNVYLYLKKEDLAGARIAVSRIVGRDTQNLSEEGVIKAAVETVAENFSDGVFAPLFYMLIGGAPLAMVYKAVNTMDSMIAYKNDRYIYFGRCAAYVDDAANFIPSRIAALFWIFAAFITGFDAREAFKIWRRDRRNHASPNSAQTESACAGALGIRLAGDTYYFGKKYEKPYIGDSLRSVEAEDIIRADKMLYAAGFSALIFGLAVRLLIFKAVI